MNLKKTFARIAAVTALTAKSLLLLACPNPSGGNQDTGVDFDRDAFLVWASQPERLMTTADGSQIGFGGNRNVRMADFAYANWDRRTDKNNYDTFNRFATQYANLNLSETHPRPITVTKGGKTFNNANPMGSYMLAQKKQRAV